MKKMILNEDGWSSIIFDTDTLDVKVKSKLPNEIKSMFEIDEDCELVYNNETINVKKGQLVISVYQYNAGKAIVLIVDSNELLDALKKYESDREESRNSRSDKLCENSVENIPG